MQVLGTSWAFQNGRSRDSTVWMGAMPSEPERDSTVDPAVEPEASELDEGPAISVTIAPFCAVITDLRRRQLHQCLQHSRRFQQVAMCEVPRVKSTTFRCLFSRLQDCIPNFERLLEVISSDCCGKVCLTPC